MTVGTESVATRGLDWLSEDAAAPLTLVFILHGHRQDLLRHPCCCNVQRGSQRCHSHPSACGVLWEKERRKRFKHARLFPDPTKNRISHDFCILGSKSRGKCDIKHMTNNHTEIIQRRCSDISHCRSCIVDA